MRTAHDPRTVILADDHPAFREGIKQYLEAKPGVAVVAETGDGESCIELLRLHRPDWALVDLAMPAKSGFEVLRAVIEDGLETRVLVLSMYADDAYARRAHDAGADGFIAKEDAMSELDAALASPPGGFFTSPSVGRPTIVPLDENALGSIGGLTPAERRILLLLGQGQTSREIAAAVEISPRTVQKHRQNMANKLGLHGPNRLLEFAVRHVKLLER